MGDFSFLFVNYQHKNKLTQPLYCTKIRFPLKKNSYVFFDLIKLSAGL
jgi:hypothetical protein